MRLSEIYILEASDITTKRVEKVILGWAKNRGGISGKMMNDLIELVADGIDAVMTGQEHPDTTVSFGVKTQNGDPADVMPWSIVSTWQMNNDFSLGMDAEGELMVAIEPLFKKNAPQQSSI